MFCDPISECLSLCSTHDHPLNVLLRNYQYHIYNALEPIVVQQLGRIEEVTIPQIHIGNQSYRATQNDKDKGETNPTETGKVCGMGSGDVVCMDTVQLIETYNLNL